MLIHKCFVTFCLLMRSTLMTINSTLPGIPIYWIMTIHVEQSKVNTNTAFSINVWCGTIGESLDHTSSHKVWYVKFMLKYCNIYCQQSLFKKVPLWTWHQMSYQHDVQFTHFSQIVMQYLNQQLTGHGAEQNWPQWSMYMTLLG